MIMRNSIPQFQEPFEDCVCPYVRKKMNEKHKNVMGYPCNLFLKEVCKDILKSIIKREVKIIALISFFVGFIMYFFNSLCLECVKEFYFSVLPSLLGFSITIYTVLFGINDTIRNRLQQKASDGKIPIEVLHSTFILGIIIQGVALILGMFVDIIAHLLSKSITGSICCFILTFIILWTLNTVFHLYSFRTFTYNNQK